MNGIKTSIKWRLALTILGIAMVQAAAIEFLVFILMSVGVFTVELIRVEALPEVKMHWDGWRFLMFVGLSLGLNLGLKKFHEGLTERSEPERLRCLHDVELGVLLREYPGYIKKINDELEAIKKDPDYWNSTDVLEKKSALHHAVIQYKKIKKLEDQIDLLRKVMNANKVHGILASQDQSVNIMIQKRQASEYELLITQGALEHLKEEELQWMLINAMMHIKKGSVEAYQELSHWSLMLTFPVLVGIKLMGRKNAKKDWGLTTRMIRGFIGATAWLWGLPGWLIIGKWFEWNAHQVTFEVDRATVLWMKKNALNQLQDDSVKWPKFLIRQRPSARLKRVGSPSRSTLLIPSSWATTTWAGSRWEKEEEGNKMLKLHPLAGYLHRRRSMKEWVGKDNFLDALWTLPDPVVYILPPTRYFWLGTQTIQRMHYMPGFKVRLAKFKFKSGHSS